MEKIGFMAQLIRVCRWEALLAIEYLMLPFTHRLAHIEDLPELRQLMSRAIEQLQHDFLSPEQVRASHSVMGLDTQLVKDQTYFKVEIDNRIIGCGGWSWRATLYGGDNSIIEREPAALNPAFDAAKVRAMYTDPDFTRRGVGRLILKLCEEAARNANFQRTEMMATLAGEPLYRAYGYQVTEQILSAPIDGVCVPLLRMEKTLI
jgi:GNAT superfamily N-acetyltransferase